MKKSLTKKGSLKKNYPSKKLKSKKVEKNIYKKFLERFVGNPVIFQPVKILGIQSNF